MVTGRVYSLVTVSPYNYDKTWMMTNKNFFQFSVRACQNASLLLTEDPRALRHGTSEVVLGYNDNMMSSLQPNMNNPDYEVADSPNILHCAQFRKFWVSWTYEGIKVGQDAVGENVLLSRDFSLGDITSIALSVGGTNDVGIWNFNQESGHSLRVESPTQMTIPGDMQRMWVTVDHLNGKSFAVKACKEAHVYLSTFYGYVEKDAYEVVIGTGGNTRSEIRAVVGGTPVASTVTEQILDCNAFRRFWVSWVGGRIEVGTGRIVGNFRMLEWTDSQPISIHFFSVGTSDNTEGTWDVNTYEGDLYSIHTPAVSQYSKFWLIPDQNRFVFTVQACQAASVYLTGSGVDTYKVIGKGSIHSVIV